MPAEPQPCARNDGEIIVITLQGQTFRLKIEDAQTILRRVRGIADDLYDAITMAQGINPRSGDPL